jgi:hypothetical protein
VALSQCADTCRRSQIDLRGGEVVAVDIGASVDARATFRPFGRSSSGWCVRQAEPVWSRAPGAQSCSRRSHGPSPTRLSSAGRAKRRDRDRQDHGSQACAHDRQRLREAADTALAFVRKHGPGLPPTTPKLTRPASGVSIPVARLWLDLFHNVHPDAGGVFEPESPLTPRFLS